MAIFNSYVSSPEGKSKKLGPGFPISVCSACGAESRWTTAASFGAAGLGVGSEAAPRRWNNLNGPWFIIYISNPRFIPYFHRGLSIYIYNYIYVCMYVCYVCNVCNVCMYTHNYTYNILYCIGLYYIMSDHIILHSVMLYNIIFCIFLYNILCVILYIYIIIYITGAVSPIYYVGPPKLGRGEFWTKLVRKWVDYS